MKNYDVSNGVMIYYLPKELDHYAAEKIKKRSDSVFKEENIKFLIFDFQDTSFMDSSGIGLITGRFRKVHDKGGCVYAINVRPEIDKILKMSGIYRILFKKENKEEIISEMIEGGYYE
ncbi:MAG: STAS domain-containing protein [Lachnospiraceae bacterium]|nr:STAS domain-containing protein [Lachnospiraceae bacterium]